MECIIYVLLFVRCKLEIHREADCWLQIDFGKIRRKLIAHDLFDLVSPITAECNSGRLD